MTRRAPALAPALVISAVLPLLVGWSPLQGSNRDVAAGNQLMKEGKAEEALQHYDKAAARLPNDPGVHFDRGTALFALSRFDEAAQEFLRATEAKDIALKASAFYNLGNAFAKKEKHKEAVEAYKRALALDPKDQRAKWNLELALKRQKEEEQKKKDDEKDDQNKKDDEKDKQDQKDQKKKDEPEKDEPKSQDQNGQDQRKPEPQQPQADPADRQEIESVLDSLEKSPKDLERQRARLRAVRRRPPEKDW